MFVPIRDCMRGFACENSAENAAMEAKLKKLEADVTSESQVHAELEKTRNALKSRVRIRLVVKMNA